MLRLTLKNLSPRELGTQNKNYCVPHIEAYIGCVPSVCGRHGSVKVTKPAVI